MSIPYKLSAGYSADLPFPTRSFRKPPETAVASHRMKYLISSYPPSRSFPPFIRSWSFLVLGVYLPSPSFFISVLPSFLSFCLPSSFQPVSLLCLPCVKFFLSFTSGLVLLFLSSLFPSSFLLLCSSFFLSSFAAFFLVETFFFLSCLFVVIFLFYFFVLLLLDLSPFLVSLVS